MRRRWWSRRRGDDVYIGCGFWDLAWLFLHGLTVFVQRTHRPFPAPRHTLLIRSVEVEDISCLAGAF